MVFTQKRYKFQLKHLFVLIFAFTCTFQALPQRRYKVYEDYIEKYSPIAVRNMQKHRIPASIILAQGLLESGAGQSDLTKRSNNHFGIKCHRNIRSTCHIACNLNLTILISQRKSKEQAGEILRRDVSRKSESTTLQCAFATYWQFICRMSFK